MDAIRVRIYDIEEENGIVKRVMHLCIVYKLHSDDVIYYSDRSFEVQDTEPLKRYYTFVRSHESFSFPKLIEDSEFHLFYTRIFIVSFFSLYLTATSHS